MNLNIEKRNMLLYVIGSSMSQFGSLIYSFAIGLYVLNETGSGMKFATTLIISFLPMLLVTPFAGVFADKFNRKKIIILMDIFNSLLFFTMFIYIIFKPLNLFIIYSSLLITNILTTFFTTTIEASKPCLVSSKNLQNLNSLSQVIISTSGILSPIIGGFIYSLINIQIFILINGISFLFSAIISVFINFDFNKKNSNQNKESINKILISLKEGYNYLLGKKEIIKLFSFFIALNLTVSLAIQVPLPFIINNYLKLGASTYGFINTLFPVGMIVGAMIVSKFTKKYNSDNLLVNLSYTTSFLTILLGLPLLMKIIISTPLSSIIYLSIIVAFFGITISLIDIPILTKLQNILDDEYRGRALGILLPIVKITNPLGYLLAGFFINKVNPFYIPFITGILLFIFVLIKKNSISSKNYCMTNQIGEKV